MLRRGLKDPFKQSLDGAPDVWLGLWKQPQLRKELKKSAEPMPPTNAYLATPDARPCRIDDASRTQFLPACFAAYNPASAAFTSSSRVLP
jgi:hypothetical protein